MVKTPYSQCKGHELNPWLRKILHATWHGQKKENGIVTRILSCKNRIASLCPTQDTASLGLVHGDDPERCYGEGGGRGVHVWEHMYTCGGFMSMYGKPIQYCKVK